MKLNAPDVDIKGMQEAISEDVSLTINCCPISTRPCTRCHARSPRSTVPVMLVGQQKIRAWASLIVLATVDDKSRELVTTGAVRARMCEHLARALKLPKPERSFLVGLLSVLDALLDQSMAEVVQSLPLERDVWRLSFLTREAWECADVRPGIRETELGRCAGCRPFERRNDPRSLPEVAGVVPDHPEQLRQGRNRKSLLQVALQHSQPLLSFHPYALPASLSGLDARRFLQLTCSLPKGAPDVERV